MAKTNSASPKVIMENAVPDLRVVTKPSNTAKPKPAKPPKQTEPTNLYDV
jgi:hypothetical protein